MAAYVWYLVISYHCIELLSCSFSDKSVAVEVAFCDACFRVQATHGVDFEALWQRLSPIFAGSDNMSGSSMQDDVRVTRSTSEQPS